MSRHPIRTKHVLVANLEAELLRRLRARGGLSRVELARELHLAASTAGIYVDRLIRDGLVLESHKADREQGRPPTLLRPNPDGGRFIGVDFEARTIQATVVDFSLQVVRQDHRAIRETDNAERVLTRLEEVVATALEGDRRPLLGIGVGVPGSIDPAAGIARGYAFIRGWKDIPLARRLQEKFGVPVSLENNIRSMAMAELWFGQGLGLRNFLCLGVRTGIGAGVVANGQLLCGEHGSAGTVGAWPLPGKTFATLETASSLRAILGELGPAADFNALSAAVQAREKKALRAVAAAAKLHAWALYQLDLLFDPQRMILVGPLAELGEAYLQPVREAVRSFSPPSGAPKRAQAAAPPKAEIVNSALGRFSGAFGAAALALHQWKPSR